MCSQWYCSMVKGVSDWIVAAVKRSAGGLCEGQVLPMQHGQEVLQHARFKRCCSVCGAVKRVAVATKRYCTGKCENTHYSNKKHMHGIAPCRGNNIATNHSWTLEIMAQQHHYDGIMIIYIISQKSTVISAVICACMRACVRVCEIFQQ